MNRTELHNSILEKTRLTFAHSGGAGGLGETILTGLGLMRNDLLWLGGVTVAALSLGAGFLLNSVYMRITRYQRV